MGMGMENGDDFLYSKLYSNGYYGAFAADAEGGTITNCYSAVSFTNLGYDNRYHGFVYSIGTQTGCFFDKDLRVVKKLSLRGVPTTLLVNQEGKEFARVIGSIDFADAKFISWVKNF